MAKMHPVEAEIAKAFGLKRGANDNDKKWKQKLHEAATDEDAEDADEKWDSLSEDAQAWVNAATDAKDDKNPLPDFDDVGGEPAAAEEPDPDDGAEEEESKPTGARGKFAATKKAKGDAATASTGKKGGKEPAKKSGGGKRGGGEEGYKGHRSGSRKEKIHRIYDDKGADAAFKAGEKEELSPATVRTWIGSWGGVKGSKGGSSKGSDKASEKTSTKASAKGGKKQVRRSSRDDD
jgi:hypothetical protein